MRAATLTLSTILAGAALSVAGCRNNDNGAVEADVQETAPAVDPAQAVDRIIVLTRLWDNSAGFHGTTEFSIEDLSFEAEPTTVKAAQDMHDNFEGDSKIDARFTCFNDGKIVYQIK